MKSKFLALLFLVAASILVFGSSAFAQGAYVSGSVGNDVSWPNCSAKAPTGGVFGIVGVTGGRGFSQNSCLAKQAAWFKNLSLYVNTGYPGQMTALTYQNSPRVCPTTDWNCLAYNYGYNAGQYAANYAQSQGVTSSTWWLDVENNTSWSSDYLQNQSSLQGETDALKAVGVTTVGVYSTTAQWQSITNGWQNNLPNWGATTWNTAKQAAKYCTGHNFTGGGTLLLQFTGRLDQDYAC